MKQIYAKRIQRTPNYTRKRTTHIAIGKQKRNTLRANFVYAENIDYRLYHYPRVCKNTANEKRTAGFVTAVNATSELTLRTILMQSKVNNLKNNSRSI